MLKNNFLGLNAFCSMIPMGGMMPPMMPGMPGIPPGELRISDEISNPAHKMD